MPKPVDPSGSYVVIESWADVVFSLDGGFVWASWPGTEASIKLGKYEPVSAMMQDFLDQNALGEHLARNAGER